MQVEILRGSQVESSHLVDVMIVDAAGKKISSFGDATINVYPRSAIKPIQAIPFVVSKAHEKAPDRYKAIALACASHGAQDIHLDFLKEWHREIRLSAADLVCGPQPPEDPETLKALIKSDRKPERIHNNCSGKHTGLLAACLAYGWPLEGYQSWNHPIQVEIRKHMSRFSGVDHDQAPWGIDGCGIPTYKIPLEAAARMMSVMLDPDSRAGGETAEALKLIRESCAKEPLMIAGRDHLCSVVGEVTNGKVFSKIGAEGNYVALIYEKGLAISLKARDGSFRACEAALWAILDKFGDLPVSELEKIRACAAPPLKNWAGDLVGSIRARF